MASQYLYQEQFLSNMPVQFFSLKHLTDEEMRNIRKDVYMPVK